MAELTQAFTFAAYGEMIALHDAFGASLAVTERLSTLGYSGEHFDAKAQQQYLRARFYNPANGRFNRLDPYAGNMQDPQSLHKYAYVHGDPITYIDPTGLFSVGGIGVSIGIIGMMGGMPPGPGDVVQAMYEGLLNSYVANLNWDIEWADNWDLADDLHSHSDDSWVSAVLVDSALGVYQGWWDGLTGFATDSDPSALGPIPASAAMRRPPGSNRNPRAPRTRRFNSGVSRYSYSYTHRYKDANGRVVRSKVDYYSHPRLGHYSAIRFQPNVVQRTVRVNPTPLPNGKQWSNATKHEKKISSDGDMDQANARLRRNGLPSGWRINGRQVEINGKPHVWHHDTRRGQLQLVPKDLHDAAKASPMPQHVGHSTWHNPR